MNKLKTFKQFLNENVIEDEQNVQLDEVENDEYIDKTDDFNDIEPEESTDILEIKYNKEDEEWIMDGELDNPNDFENFYNWFVDMDEENTLASMKEDDDEVVFYLPEDLYVEYLEEQKNIEPDEESLEEEDVDEDWNDEDWNDEDYDEEN
jgi:hypothetical protein